MSTCNLKYSGDTEKKMALDGNVVVWKFNMKNRFLWRYRPEAERVGAVEMPKLIIMFDKENMEL